MRLVKFSLIIGLLQGQYLHAAPPDDIPSCYEFNKLTEYKPEKAKRHLIVIVDQTSQLDDKLKKTVHAQIDQFITAGDQIQIISFSANAGGRYTDIIYNGVFDHLLPSGVRNQIAKTTLNRFDACIAAQAQAKDKLHRKLRSAYGETDHNFSNTELVGSLLQVGSSVIASSSSERAVVLIVSDMLENSNITSFYANNSVRKIDPKHELQKVMNSGITGDFGGADIFVIGAGFTGKGMAYSSQLALDNLEVFWRDLFSQHNGNLRLFGKPQLLSTIK